MALAAVMMCITGLSCKPGQPRKLLNRPAPDFMLQDIDGNRFYLSAHKGKPVLLNFWSVHCVPCLKEMPQLQKLWSRYKDEKVVVTGICTDPGESSYLLELLKGMNIDYPILIDNDHSVGKAYAVHAEPVTFIIDAEGVVRFHATGYDQNSIKNYTAQLIRLMQQRGANET